MQPRAIVVSVACSACLGAFACEPAPYLHPLESTASSSGSGGSTTGGPQAVVAVGTGVTGPSGTSSGGGGSCGFGGGSNVALPTGYLGASSAGAFPTLQGGPSCVSGADVPSYVLADLDGDGLLDMVFTSQCDHTEVGATVWWWFKNTAGSFATTAATWALPTSFSGTAPFPALAGNVACTNGLDTPTFTLVDMDFDGRADLLVTAACNHTEVGSSVWWMFKNTGTGFASTPTMLALPSGFTTSPLPFPTVAGTLDCNGQSGAPEYVLADATNDGKPDLILTETCANTTVGETSWVVYPGGDAGFTAAPITLTLPTGYTTTSRVFGDVQGALDCNSGTNAPSFVLLYWNPDGYPDLLVTRTCEQPTVGVSEWLLYVGSATGFATTAETITLPTGYGSTSTPAFGAIDGALDCASSATTPSFVLVDMNADGFLDLLVTERCNDSITGTTQWLVYEGSATGFSAEPALVTLPTGYVAASGGAPVFANSAGDVACTGGADKPSYELMDLNGDARPDIVVTSRCNDTTTGMSRWLLSSSTCQ